MKCLSTTRAKIRWMPLASLALAGVLMAAAAFAGGEELQPVATTLSAEQRRALIADARGKGSAERGRQVYQRAAMACTTCHLVDGKGGQLGPDLSTVGSYMTPESILESELFGHEKGSFTGAVGQKQGLIEQSNGGTFFLDEIQEMTQSLQVKLLRAIQEREIRRVGGSEAIKVDFRLVAATNVNLREQMEEKTFRADLYYRLASIEIHQDCEVQQHDGQRREADQEMDQGDGGDRRPDRCRLVRVPPHHLVRARQ